MSLKVSNSSKQEQHEKSALEKLKKIAQKAKIPPERYHLPRGAAKELIVTTAEAIKADLIVIGTHSRHDIASLILGSTATGVLHKTKCDVLAVQVGKQATKTSKENNEELAFNTLTH